MAKPYQNQQAAAPHRHNGQKRPVGSIIRARVADPHPILPTALDEPRYCGIPYVDCYHYFDTLYFQSASLLGSEDYWWLKDHCRRFDILYDGEIVYDRRSRKRRMIFIPRPYRFQFEVHCPDPAAEEFLARVCTRKTRRLVAVHAARDFTFDHRRDDKRRMLEFVDEHWVQPYQRRTRNAARFDNGAIDNGGGSTGRRSKGHYETHYASEHCRIDGIVECFHMEERMLGKLALSKIGINSPLDLLTFHHEAFWLDVDVKSLRAIDFRRLGQFHRNRVRGSRSGPSAKDLRISGLLIRKYGLDDNGNFCTQKLIQKYGRGPFVRSACDLRLSEQNT